MPRSLASTNFHKAFRPGNVDLPTNLNIYSAAALNVADKISDPIMPDIDPSVLDFGPVDIDFGIRKDDPLNWTSQSLLEPVTTQPLPMTQENNRDDEDDMHVELELDLGDDDTPDIEIGRKDNGISNPFGNEIISDDDKFQNTELQDIEFGNDEPTRTRMSSVVLSVEREDPPVLENEDMIIDDANDVVLQMEDDPTAPIAVTNLASDSRLQRGSPSTLSSVHSSDVDSGIVHDLDTTNFDEEEVSMHQAHKAKKRKILQADANTVISPVQIKQQQADRSAILKPASFLSRDPLLLNLMNMQRNGGFVSSIMGDGRAKGWAPELRGILSIEVIRKSGELKRKRGNLTTASGSEEAQTNLSDVPQLEIPEDDMDAVNKGNAIRDDTIIREPPEIMDLPIDHDFNPIMDDHASDIHHDRRESDDEVISLPRDNFDETTAPLLHPAEQGAVSVGTQHAVHLLRDRFKSLSGSSQAHQKKSNILFQEMLPETSTSKADATKMFFEVLVLATKDAVKVDQPENQLGAPLRIRAKRGLWGAWAEKEAGGEIAQQEVASSPQAAAS